LRRMSGEHLSPLPRRFGGEVEVKARDELTRNPLPLDQVAERVMHAEGLSMNDLEWFVPHQANQRMIVAATKRLAIDDGRVLADVAEINPNAQMARQAPLGILVCGDLSLEKSKGYWIVDCSAAVENMLLAAHALGLGAVWTGVFPREERMIGLRRLVKLPDNVIAHSLVVVGYPAEHPSPHDNYHPERVHRNRW